jgi:flagellar biosynthesis protein
MAEIKEALKNIKKKDQLQEAGGAKRTAIALRYDVEKDAAPLVLASGRGVVADEILRIADENEIPLYENTKLADLLSKLELDAQIPPELFTLVAEVLFYVYQLDKMAEKKKKLYGKLKQ